MKSKKTISVLWICVVLSMLFIYAEPNISSESNGVGDKIERKKGIFIAGAGIAGSGKSSLFKALHQMLYKSNLFVEPEEDEWPEVIRNKGSYDRFTLMTAFRNMRVPNYHKADNAKKNGGIALMDACVDLMYPFFWLGSSMALGFEDWEKDLQLMIEDLAQGENKIALADYIFREKAKDGTDQSDAAKALRYMFANDLNRLPRPDVIVMFDIEFNVWKGFVKKRGREHDVNKNFEKAHGLSSAMSDAVTELVNKFNEKNDKCNKIVGCACETLGCACNEGQSISYLEQNSKSSILIGDPTDPDCIKKIVLKIEDISPSTMAERLLVILLAEKILSVKDVNFGMISLETCREIVGNKQIEIDNLTLEIIKIIIVLKQQDNELGSDPQVMNLVSNLATINLQKFINYN